MPKEPSLTSAERRARHAERQRTRRRILTNSTDPVVVTARDTARQWQRDLQHSRRERSRVACSSQLSSPFLPVHQQRAIDNFMDRVLTVRQSVRHCDTCLERYHGMHMRGTQCDRCHREVRPPFVASACLLTGVARASSLLRRERGGPWGRSRRVDRRFGRPHSDGGDVVQLGFPLLSDVGQ